MDAEDFGAAQLPLLPKFGDRFLADHAGSIIADPRIAIVELVANSWDAGADRVELIWLPDGDDHIEIRDNGTGMTASEFERRWLELNYNRRAEQGDEVEFPADNRKSNRRVFARNGKGRHGMFCFADEYDVETMKGGWRYEFHVVRTFGQSRTPFGVSQVSSEHVPRAYHGTRIWTTSNRRDLGPEDVVELLGSKFVSDPAFTILVNGHEVQLMDLSHLFDQTVLSVDGVGQVSVLLFDTETISKTTKQHGVAWWVNNRLVGDTEWKKLNGEKYLDGRASKARRYTFVVRADVLEDQVLADWSGFLKSSPKVQQVALVVEEHITQRLHDFLRSTYKERKREAIAANLGYIADLPPESRWQIGTFLDEIQVACPTIRAEYLNEAVEVLSKLERTRSGYALLQQLAQLSPDDLDGLHQILSEWTVTEAATALNELGKRLKLIERLEELVDNPSADELHDLQPLFERGLWIFGPEYESIEFTSNRSLATVIKTLFKDQFPEIETPSRRPDFVVLPDSSIGFYSCDEYDSQSEVNGIEKVLIVELKRGGFELTRKEVRQADDYEHALRRSGKISRRTYVTCFVLASSLGDDAREVIKKGDPENAAIHPRTYSTVLRQAHARTFNLANKLKPYARKELIDPEVEAMVMDSPVQFPMEVGVASLS